MKYFLDFDRTIFETGAFKRSLRNRPTLRALLKEGAAAVRESLSGTDRSTRRRIFFKTLGTFLSHGRFGFAAQELESFLYPDARKFLQTHDCIIVTYGVRAFITAKVTTALTDFPNTQVIYTSRKKGRTIRHLVDEHADSGPFVFVDDKPFQLASVERWCPDVEVIEIRRDGSKGIGRWRVIHSFDELTK